MALHIGRQKEKVGVITRAEGGAIIVDLKADLDPMEIAAIMEGVNNYCSQRGIHPGTMASALSDLQMAKRGLIRSRPG